MKTLSFAIAVLLLAPLAAAQPPQKPAKPAPAPTTMAMNKDPAAEAAMREITQAFGFVPQFMRAIPASMLPGAWALLKNVQMSTDTKLDNKTKELIGLAVSAQIPCEYCIQFHTAVARVHGASDQEIQEAVAMGAITREMSTLLNGLMVDKVQFKKDLDRIVAKARQQAKK